MLSTKSRWMIGPRLGYRQIYNVRIAGLLGDCIALLACVPP